ncbi:MAG: hypothetical protein KAG96_01885 [Ichthyobacteriaceae bacterium]|nr:hypothetical protein [Ichthyobacteriaceae bacterium]
MKNLFTIMAMVFSLTLFVSCNEVEDIKKDLEDGEVITLVITGEGMTNTKLSNSVSEYHDKYVVEFDFVKDGNKGNMKLDIYGKKAGIYKVVADTTASNLLQELEGKFVNYAVMRYSSTDVSNAKDYKPAITSVFTILSERPDFSAIGNIDMVTDTDTISFQMTLKDLL